MRLNKYGSVIFLALLLSAGCGMDQNINTHIQEGATSGPIVVHVSDGDPLSRPIYSWSDGSDTTAMDVKVVRIADLNTPVWEVQSSDLTQNLIQSPWQHGTATASVSEISSTERDLQTDIWYRVTISKTPPGSGPTGYREFLIQP